MYVIPHFFQKLLERTDGKNNKIFNFRTEEKAEIMGFLSGGNSQLYKKFRVSPVMTTSITLPISYAHLSYHISPPHATTYFFSHGRIRIVIAAEYFQKWDHFVGGSARRKIPFVNLTICPKVNNLRYFLVFSAVSPNLSHSLFYFT